MPGWKQFLAQYSSYMQIILVAAAVASMLIGEISTGVVVLAITALNALGGMRQQGKAESAMNALQSMLKASARVRRDGAEIKVDGDQVVVGDVVLLTAGDDVCADGRIIEAASLQIDESGLTGESVPASKSAEVIADDPKPGVGDQTNMAFMNSPVTHGSGVMIVTGTGADTEVGNISGTAEVDTHPEDAADRAARHADAVDRGRRRPDDRDHVRPRDLARPIDPDHLHDRDRAGPRRRAHGDAHRPAGDPVAAAPRPSPRTAPS